MSKRKNEINNNPFPKKLCFKLRSITNEVLTELENKHIQGQFSVIENECTKLAKLGKSDYFYKTGQNLAYEKFFTDELLDFKYGEEPCGCKCAEECCHTDYGYHIKW